ncbi:MAG: dipeptidyl-peptidase-4 [Arenicella sp.]|jgi:dipeptidyl-peptidase-4
MKNILLPFFIGALTISNPVFSQEKELSNDLIWASREFSADYVYSVSSMNDGEHFSALEEGKIVKYSYTDFGTPVATLLDEAKLENITIGDYFFNADETKMLLATEIKSIYRRSFTAKYFVVDLESGKAEALYDKESKEMLAEFSPDGTKVGFVYENNLYYKDLSSGKVTQVTDDGSTNGVINGSTDWVYEEEFSLTKAWEWSPKGTKIAFLKFDESEVKDFTMDYYRNEIYPEQYTFKYPKAGEDNSKLSLHIYNLEDAKNVEIQRGPFEYLPRMKWTNDDNKLMYLSLNRHQNNLVYAYAEYDETGKKGGIIHQDESTTYVDVDDNLIFLDDGESFLRTSEMDGYNHIYKVGLDGAVSQVTKGEWDVVELKGVNSKKGLIYYVSAEEGAIYKSLYSIKLDGSSKTKLSELKGSNDAQFSKGMKYYINYYSNANDPARISVHNSKGKEIDVLVDNKDLKAKLKEYNLSKKEFITIKGHDGQGLNAFVVKPPNFDESKKYPVYFNIYNGPGHNTVTDSWGGSNFLYHQLLAQEGYIVISVDTRGTMYRGADFKKSTYLQLGKLETEDMIACAKEVQKWKFVDPERIGVMGWSYGGYMTSLCMTKGADVFKMGIAVAPVTNWKWYDNIYTERFMRTPAENNDGYEDNSPINHVSKMKGKYLLVHGSGDDNVHVQNSMEMINALVKENKDFEMFIYTNKNHSIYGGYTRLHLFNKLLTFTKANL